MHEPLRQSSSIVLAAFPRQSDRHLRADAFPIAFNRKKGPNKTQNETTVENYLLEVEWSVVHQNNST